MANTSLRIGNGKWAVKESSLLGYNVIQDKYVPIEMGTVRATTATRVNENGLIEVVPKNFALYSNTLSNAVWTKASTTITSNALISPDGTVNANKIVEDTTTNLHRAGQGAIAVTSGQIYTFSFYAKAGERNELELQRINTSGTVFNSISVTTADLTLGTLSVGSNVTSSSINSVGNGWYKISLSLTAIATGSGGLNIGMQKDGSVSYLGDGTSGVYVYGFQAEQGSTATSYFPTTDRLNIPRIDYTSGEGAILVEGQRTNLLTYSEQFDNASWSKFRSSIIVNNTTAPDGVLTADKIVEDTATGTHDTARNITLVSGSVYSFSFFAKKAERNWVSYYDNTTGGFQYFDLQNGVLGSSSIGSGNIENYGNGWFKCTYIFTQSGTVGRTNIRIATSNGVSSYLGDGTSGLYLWGAQLEAGSYATSYIPTVASSVTRNADVISKTGISSLIGQTEGTIFVEVQITDGKINTSSDDLRIIELASSNGLTAINLQLQDTNVLRFVRVSSTQSANTVIADSALTTGGTFKMAAAYKNSDLAFYINGEQIGTSSETFTLESVTDMFIGASKTNSLQIGDSIKQVVLFKERLSNTELATLTTI